MTNSHDNESDVDANVDVASAPETDNEEEAIQEPVYDRNEVLTSLTNFYTFLTKLYLPDSCLNTPPAEGWPIPSSTKFSPPKSPEVIHLIQHMPYLSFPPGTESAQIYEKCEAVNYSRVELLGEKNEDGSWDVDPNPMHTTLPSHALMMGYARGRNGHYVFLDTKRGTWTLCDFQVGPKGQTEWSEAVDDIEDPVTRTGDDGEEYTEKWREYATYPTKEFFEFLTKSFTELDVTPFPNGEVHFARGEDGETFKGIFADCGWPSDNYRKDECMEKVAEYDRKRIEGA